MSKKPIIDEIKVKKPCSENWNEMSGNDKVRFCSHCSKSVSNISEMSQKDALRLVRDSNGNLCVRYIVDPKTHRPLFLDSLVQLTRRVPKLAAGVMSASISLSSMALAQTQINEDIPVIVQSQSNKYLKEPVSFEGGRLIGVVHDNSGIVMPGTYLTLINEADSSKRTAVTDQDGSFQFTGLEAGTYTLRRDGSGDFPETENKGIQVYDGETVSSDLYVGNERMITMGEIAIPIIRKTPLARAVMREDTKAVRDLLVNGADVNGREEDKSTPLFFAVENGNVEITRLLLDFGARVNARNEQKETPLMKLDGDATRELVELLIHSGARLDAVDVNGNSPLVTAAGGSRAEVLQVLVESGAYIDQTNASGMTPLMIAASYGNLEAVRILLQAGADIRIKDLSGQTASDKSGDQSIQDLFASYGAQINRTVNSEPVFDGPVIIDQQK